MLNMNSQFKAYIISVVIGLFAYECKAAGGLAGLKELTDDMPYIGYGNRWDSFPQVADGGAGLFNNPYSGDYDGYSPYRYGYGGYGSYGGYGNVLYGNYGGGFGRGMFARSAGTPVTVESSSSSDAGRFYTGRGNAFVNHK